MTVRVLDLLPGRSDQVQRVSLDGGVYQLRFRWNDRAACWFLDIAGVDGLALATGIAVRVGSPFGLPHATRAGMPPGLLMAADRSQSGTDPALDDLGDRVRVYYLEAADVADIANG